ncbi:hypothetical protein HanPSC8_Chr16g0696921 [Helianthus annuus]|nr:hypothetical protein HanPSC8_Chr16g0696921 [Helianthus annuus]
MLAAIETATKRASPWQTAIATRPDGSKAASAVSFACTISDSRTDTREDEEQSGDELSNVGFDGAGAEGIIKTTKGNSRHFSRRSEAAEGENWLCV